LVEQRLLYSANMNIPTMYHSFCGAVCAGAVALITSSGQAQNLFEADNGSGNVYEFTPGGARSTFASGFAGLTALAFNSAGDLFVADAGSGDIYKFTPNGTRTIFASGLAEPTALAFNSAGDLFATDQSSRSIYEFTPDGTRTTFASGLGSPVGLAFNSAGELFEADWTNIYTNTPPFTFTDSMATTLPCRFYRALLGP
jgi:glucose/arabinose dehydrogenase